MDALRFDSLTRIVSTAGSRRRAVATALGGVLVLRGLGDSDDATARKKCPPCKKRNKQGRCKKKKPDGAACGVCRACSGGSCVLQSNDAACNGDGKCLNGTCNPKPTCKAFTTACSAAGPDPSCCSGSCVSALGSQVCSNSSSGQACYDNDIQQTPFGLAGECRSGACVGYRCQ